MERAVMLSLLLVLQTDLACAYQNVALRGKATQSQVGPHSVSGAASNAIDGNPNPSLSSGSCSQSAKQSNPWWRVDLLEEYIIDHMVLTSRGDCCEEEIRGAEIRIGNSACAPNALVASVSSIPAGSSHTINFTDRVAGRYVTITRPGPDQALTLCEVEVYGFHAPVANVAVYGKASQSTVYPGAIAYNAIDGNRESLFDRGSCSATNNDFSPWWRLDLGRTHKVFSINITNRFEVPERINGAEIRIGDGLDNYGNNNPRCAVIATISPGFTETFQCNGMNGRYINVVIPGRTEYLTLCEVEVLASVLD